MTKRSALWVMLALGLGIGTFVACHGGKGVDTGTSPSIDFTPVTPVATSTPVPKGSLTTGTGICTDKNTWKSPDGTLQICEISRTLELGGDICQPVPVNGGSWTYTFGIISTGAGYFFDATFSGPENGCGSIGATNPGDGGQGHGAYHDKRFPAGESKMTFTFTEDGNSCGRKQDDIDAVNEASGARLNIIGFVLGYLNPCTTCDDGRLTATEQQVPSDNKVTETITVTLKDKKLPFTITWGDGTIDSKDVAGQYVHTYPGGETEKSYTVIVSYGAQYKPCDAKFIVKVPPVKKKECGDYTKPSIVLTDNTTLTETQLTGSVTATPANGSWSPAQAFPYNRPNAGQTATALHFNYTVPYGPEGLQCTVSKAIDLSVPPKDDSCANYTKPTVVLTAYTSLTPTQMTGYVEGTPEGGSWSPAQAFPYDRPNAGQPPLALHFDYTVKYGPESLKCSTSKGIDLSVAPKDRACADMAASCNAVDTSPLTSPVATVKTTCTWTPPPSVGQLTLTPFTTSINPGDVTQADVNRTSSDQTFNYGLKLNGQTCVTGSIVVKAKECEKKNVWTIKNKRSDNVDYTIIIATDKNHPASTTIKTFVLGPGESDTFEGYNNTTLHAFYKLGTPGHYNYDWADSKSSGSCGASSSSVWANWAGDAKLSVECTCPVPR